MKNYLYIISFLCAIFQFSASHIKAQIQRPIGINLTDVVDWSSEFVFVDVMKQSRAWIPHDFAPNSDWTSGVDIPLGENGYPLVIPFNNGIDPVQGIRTVMLTDLENIFPAGEYRMISSGTGEIQLWGAASTTFRSPIDTLIQLDNSNGILGLEILESNETDPIHDIHLIMPGFHNTFESEPFHPSLLSFIDDFQLIRFMDWTKTNNSEVREWAERNTPNNYSQTTENGISYEYLIAISNLLQKDFWINIPHQASDDFIRQYAEMLHDQADPNLKIYLEYSNEVWNNIFTQNEYAAQAAADLGFEGEPWELAWIYTAKRSADVFQIFEEVFVDDDRLIKVIPGFAVSAWINNFILERFNDSEINPTGVKADALAIAPYFGGSVADAIAEAGLANTITVDAIIDSLEISLEETYRYMEENKDLADEYELDYIAYEGGQHLVASFPYNEEEAFVDKLLEANRHPSMEDLYCSYFDHWFDTVKGGMFANFSSHGGYGQFGSWGLKETYDDINAPKYQGLVNCVFSFNTTSTNTKELNNENKFLLYPNIVDDQFTLEGQLTNKTIHIYNLHGQLEKTLVAQNDLLQIPASHLHAGIYFVQISNPSEQPIQTLRFMKH